MTAEPNDTGKSAPLFEPHEPTTPENATSYEVAPDHYEITEKPTPEPASPSAESFKDIDDPNTGPSNPVTKPISNVDGLSPHP